MGEVRCRQSLPYLRVEGLLPERPPTRYRASKQTIREKKRKTCAKDNTKQAKKPRTKQAAIDKSTYRQRRREAGKQAEKHYKNIRKNTSTSSKKNYNVEKAAGKITYNTKKHIKAQTSYRQEEEAQQRGKKLKSKKTYRQETPGRQARPTLKRENGGSKDKHLYTLVYPNPSSPLAS
ncbi:hypothetical protein Tco_0387177 [Tanacetum coccineum]